MKKIFYIVLVIVALMVISRFVKQGNQTVPTEIIAVEEVAPDATMTEEIAVDENGNPIAEEEVISEDEADAVEDAAAHDEDEVPADAVPAEAPADASTAK